MTSDKESNAAPPITVLLVAPYVPPHLGGLEKYVFNLAAQLAERHGMRVIVATTSASDVSISATEAVFSDIKGVELMWLPVLGKVSNTPVGFGWISKLRKIIETEKVALVNAHGPVPVAADLAAVAASTVPFVLTYHFGPMAKGNRWVDPGIRLYEKSVLQHTVNKSEAVIAVSEHVNKTLPRSANGLQPSIIYPAVDTELFSPGGEVPDESRVLFVGTLTAATRHKGLLDLIEAVELLLGAGHSIFLEVVGSGDDLDFYREDVRGRGIADVVCFSGALQGPELAEAYRRSSLLVVPSRFDNFPTVAIEAMACGRPVVATNVGSVVDLVQDGKTGVIVQPSNVEALASGILEVLADPDMATEMGQFGRVRAMSQFSLEVQSDATVAVFREAIARGKKR